MSKKVFVLIILVTTPVFGFNPNTDSSLVGWWALNEGSGTIARDDSGNGNNGSLKGDPKWVDGVLGGALELDGDGDYVDTGNTENLSEYTLAIWVISPYAPRSNPPSGPMQRQNNYVINWDHTDTNYQGAAAMNPANWRALKFGTLEGNTWYHLAVTFDGANWITYQDGEQANIDDTVTTAPAGESYKRYRVYHQDIHHPKSKANAPRSCVLVN